jgi:guanine deaminase
MHTHTRGLTLCPDPARRAWRLIDDAVITWSAEGVVRAVETARDYEAREGELPPVTHPGGVWLPGFIDTHVHYPQTQIIGSASGPLLAWLERSVFPEEARFAHEGYAERVAERFCDQLLQQGTTSASIYSSSHPGATDVLFKTLSRRGLRAEAGLTLMDRGAPEALLRPAEEALEACEALVERWHGHDEGRLRFCVTPRFGLSCTPALLRGAGLLARSRGLWVQTHISENPLELEATAAAFPTARDYLAVYEDLGLLHERTLLAHCIWLSEGEWDRLSAARATVTHCPDSNLFLGSGQMPIGEALSRGVRVGLGSDVGAGRSFSLRRAAARAYDASRITGASVTPSELLWLATRGGALATGRGDEVGCVAEGYEADLVCVALPPDLEVPSGLSEGERVELIASRLVFCEDWQGVREVRVRGRQVWVSDAP